MSDIVRVLRILEYVGPRELIEKTMENNAVPSNGTYRVNGNFMIRSAIIGSYPEILEQNNDKESIK